MTIPAPNFYYNLIGVAVLPIYHGGGRWGGVASFLARKRKKESREKPKKFNSKVFIMSIEHNIRAPRFIVKTIVKS
jgi:hypothetical protein